MALFSELFGDISGFYLKKNPCVALTGMSDAISEMPCCLNGMEVKRGFMGFSTSTSMPLFLEVVVQ